MSSESMRRSHIHPAVNHPHPSTRPSSLLDGALGDSSDSPARWYEYYSNTHEQAGSVNRPRSILPVSSQFKNLEQFAYAAAGQELYIPKTHVSFLDDDERPTFLWRMNKADWRTDGQWNEPWTHDMTVGQKMHLRVRSPGRSRSNYRIDKLLSAWDFRKERQPIKKAKLGCLVAEALLNSSEMKEYCIGHGYDLADLALSDLVNVSQGSWQPTLHVKVA